MPPEAAMSKEGSRGGATRRSLVQRAAALGGGLAAGCGATAGTEPPRAATLAAATLVFVDPDGADLGDTKQQASEAFSQRHPAVKVDRVFGEGSKAGDSPACTGTRPRSLS
jgi:ABC-type glycerol-3-phosphate transport system substrate-binding protein